MTLTPQQLQEEQKPWVLHNFGPGAPHQPLLGMFEELAELDKAIDDWNVPEIRDALADTVIFCSDYCTKRGWEFAPLFDNWRWITPSRDLFASLRYASRYLGYAAHCQLKSEQGIRGSAVQHATQTQEELRSMLMSLQTIALHFGWDLMEIVEPVWARVKQRDFKKNAENGGQPT